MDISVAIQDIKNEMLEKKECVPTIRMEFDKGHRGKVNIERELMAISNVLDVTLNVFFHAGREAGRLTANHKELEKLSYITYSGEAQIFSLFSLLGLSEEKAIQNLVIFVLDVGPLTTPFGPLRNNKLTAYMAEKIIQGGVVDLGPVDGPHKIQTGILHAFLAGFCSTRTSNTWLRKKAEELASVVKPYSRTEIFHIPIRPGG